MKANPIRRGSSAPRRAPDRLGDFVKIDCAACHHVALLTRERLLRVGLSPGAKVLDFRGRLRSDGSGRGDGLPKEARLAGLYVGAF